MPRKTKVVGFSVPPSIAKEMEQVAREERRTKSELFREMWRVYLFHRKGVAPNQLELNIAGGEGGDTSP